MEPWLSAALDYIPRWFEFQMTKLDQPGAVIALARNGEVVLERAFGVADLQEPMTPRHRFRIASHSKSFTAAGIMKLKEQGRLRLEDPAGDHVSNLDRDISKATLGQLLSHCAGTVRDGPDGGQFLDRRAFLRTEELKADLAQPQPFRPGDLFKYSNHGYGLLGLVIEAITKEPFDSWIKREILD
ncbi:MAG: serine hydrolase domain-containing protein, partial [Geminicoccaceae bacterium]